MSMSEVGRVLINFETKTDRQLLALGAAVTEYEKRQRFDWVTGSGVPSGMLARLISNEFLSSLSWWSGSRKDVGSDVEHERSISTAIATIT